LSAVTAFSLAAASARRRPERGAVLRGSVRAVLLGLLMGAGMAAAAPPASPDSALTDTLRAGRPRGALIRSAILPGWGQYYNRRPAKALLFASTSGVLLGSAIAEQRSLERASTPREHEDRAARRNTRFLLLVLSATLSALDAYVDAQLSGFAADRSLDLEVGPGSVWLNLGTVW
jgi:hypothetical protein